MNEPRRFGLAELAVFLLIVFSAAGARAWYLRACCENGSTAGPLEVQGQRPRLALALPPETTMRGQQSPTELDALIHNLKAHRWFGGLAPFAAAEEQTAHTAPGYPWLVAWLEQAPLNLGPPDRTLRWLQAALGALTAGLYFLFGLWAFRSRFVAVVLGVACAVHPFWVVNTAEIDDGVLATFLLAASLWLGASAGQEGGPFRSLLLGLALAALALVRAALLPFAFVAVVWYLWRCRTLRGGWLFAVVAFLGFLIGLTPWTLRNLQVFGEPVPVVSSLHLHLWMGNNPDATGGPQSEAALLDSLARDRRHRKLSRGEEPLPLEAFQADLAQSLAQKKQPQRYGELGRDVWHVVRDDPAATLRRRLWAGLYFIFGEQWFQDRSTLWRVAPVPESLDEEPEAAEAKPRMPAWLDRSYPALFLGVMLAMLLLGALGWRWSYAWRHAAAPAALALVWVPLPYLLSHAEALLGPRLPLDGVLLAYAAFALGCLLPGVRRRLLDGEGPSEEKPTP
jgi:hypothetical protein